MHLDYSLQGLTFDKMHCLSFLILPCHFVICLVTQSGSPCSSYFKHAGCLFRNYRDCHVISLQSFNSKWNCPRKGQMLSTKKFLDYRGRRHMQLFLFMQHPTPLPSLHSSYLDSAGSNYFLKASCFLNVGLDVELSLSMKHAVAISRKHKDLKIC